MTEEVQTLAANTILDDRYRLISGGDSQDLGTHYRAYDVQEGHRVNLLVLAKSWGRGHEGLERLQNLQRHVRSLDAPALVPIEDMGLLGEQVYLVRAASPDPSLADLLAQRGRLEVGLAVWIAVRLCNALAPAHRAGLVHGSLSSQSILISQSSGADPSTGVSVHLLDTGVLPALKEISATMGKPWGRPPYLSPEQAVGAPVHPSTDLYVIGSLLYEMLAGRPPFRSSDDAVLALQHLRQEPPALGILVPDLPPALDQIVRKAMAKEPAARYRNAGQLAQILRTQVAAKLPPPPLQAPPASSALAAVGIQERLVVPPPPAPTMTSTWSSGDLSQIEPQDEWTRESASSGIDWTMVALFIAALLAVLGLIPLWRAVYRRYAAPPPILAPGASYHFEWEEAPQPVAAQSSGGEIQEQAELGASGLVWYNPVPGNHSPFQTDPGGGMERSSCECAAKSLVFGSPAYGFSNQDMVHFLGRV
jgi:serine/threonine protein kinase